MVTDFVRYPLKMIIERRDVLFKCPEGGYKLAYVLRQILSGVRHLHQTGIVHRVGWNQRRNYGRGKHVARGQFPLPEIEKTKIFS